MTQFATYTINKLSGLDLDGAWCFNEVGGLEVATTPERLTDLHRRRGWSDVLGCREPDRRRRRVRPAAPAPRPRARPRWPAHPRRTAWPRPGARSSPWPGVPKRTARAFQGSTRVVGIEQAGGRVTGVRTADGVIPADIVVSCAGFWGPAVGAMVGMDVPLLPLAHQYAKTGQIAELVGRNDEASEIGLPILRNQDADLYFREHVDRIGIGSYGHRPMPVRPGHDRRRRRGHRLLDAVDAALHRRRLQRSLGQLPTAAARPARGEDRRGLQRGLLLHPGRRTVDRRVRGRRGILDRRGRLGDPLRRCRQGRCPAAGRRPHRIDLHGCDVHRFEDFQRSAGYVERDVAAELRGDLRRIAPAAAADLPAQPPRQPLPRPPGGTRRGLPRERRMGATAVVRGQRPAVGRAARRMAPPERDAWSARFHSPIAAAEAWRTREAVAHVRHDPAHSGFEVSGPGALALLTA